MIENIEDWRKAGKIAAQSLEYGRSLIIKGVQLIEVLDKIEEKIQILGGECAFPPQISMDATAAHYCADPNERTILEDQLCCLDVGVHINGCIGDNACTIDLSGKYTDLVEASKKALEEAIKIAHPGVKISDLGNAIKEAITSYGFSPIRNLSGHGLDKFQIHAQPGIPNYDTHENLVLQKGMIIAIEPFATNGKGLIQESGYSNIFSVVKKKPVRNLYTRDILKELEKYNGLPFTTRWLTRKFSSLKVNMALKELLNNNIIRSYPALVEVEKGMVSQAEHTLYIGDKVEVLTLLD